jgi:hypothetical protein
MEHLRAVQEPFPDAFSPEQLGRVDEIVAVLREHLDE